CEIHPTTNLPTITEQVTIDGYTQIDSQPNTADDGTTNAILKIQIVGDLDNDATSNGLDIEGNNSEIRGLVIDDFDHGVYVVNASGVTIGGCFIGTEFDGLSVYANDTGILGVDANNLVIGGTDPADRNLISGNDVSGLNLQDCDGAQIQGNLVGPNAPG